jgi:acyl carrier protein
VENIRNFIVEYIQREYTIPEEIDLMSLNYVASGYIDSMGLLQFLATIEDEFSIEFEDEDLEKPEIQVVGELIALIEEKRRAINEG